VAAVSGAIGSPLNNNECRETSTCPIFYEVKMSKLKQWLVTKYLQIEEQAVEAITTANFYGNLFTERQKFYIVVFFMALIAMGGSHGAVQFIALVYIMNKMTPDDKDDKQK
jgi:hypothetical protein